MIWTSGSTAGVTVVLVELVDAVPNRVVVGAAIVVGVAESTFAIRLGSSLNRDPRAIKRVLSMGVSTHRQPAPGSAGSMMENSRPMGDEIGIAGST